MRSISNRQLGDGRRPRAGVLELENVSKWYRLGNVEVRALAGVTLSVDRGAFVAVVGPSGSGKSTLLNIMGALDGPTEGRAAVNGVDTTRATARDRTAVRRASVSFVFQSFNLFPGLTALENVELGAGIARRRDGVGLARNVLERLGLGARADHFPHQLSGGEQQRVAIARALASGNPILLADEPTGELDSETALQIVDLLRDQAREGRTVVVVTHNRAVADAADRVVEIGSGRIVDDRQRAGVDSDPGHG